MCEKRFVSGKTAKPWDKFNADLVSTLNLVHNKKTAHADRGQAAKRSERAKERELGKKLVFAKRVKELESEGKFFKVTAPGQQILDLNFEVSEAESLEKPTEKGKQIKLTQKYLSTLLRKPKCLRYVSMIQLARPHNLSNEQIQLTHLFLL